MVLLMAGLGQLLNSYLQHTGFALVHRPPLALTHLEDLSVFPGKYHTSHFACVYLCKDIFRVIK